MRLFDLYKLPNLKNIYFGEKLFSKCIYLHTFDIRNLTNIHELVLPNKMFQNCQNLNVVKLPINIHKLKIGTNCFDNCLKLTSVNLFELDKLQSLRIESNAFKNCLKIKVFNLNKCTKLKIFELGSMILYDNESKPLNINIQIPYSIETLHLIDMNNINTNIEISNYENLILGLENINIATDLENNLILDYNIFKQFEYTLKHSTTKYIDWIKLFSNKNNVELVNYNFYNELLEENAKHKSDLEDANLNINKMKSLLNDQKLYDEKLNKQFQTNKKLEEKNENLQLQIAKLKDINIELEKKANCCNIL